MHIHVASKNPGKIESVRQAMALHYDDLEVIGIPVPSGVSDQPVNEEIPAGAKNRVANLKAECERAGRQANFYVAIESGLMNFYGHWVIVNIAWVEDDSGRFGYGLSPAFPVPNKYIEEIRQSDLATLSDRLFMGRDLRSHGGMIEQLTNGAISRIDMGKAAVSMALSAFHNGDLWRD